MLDKSFCRLACGNRWGKRMLLGRFAPIAIALVLTSAAEVVADPARTPLTSVGIVESIDAPPDPDDPGVGGGFDAAGYFKNVLGATVASCTKQIGAAADSWIAAQKLVSVLRDASPNHLLIHASKPGKEG